jgi:hypothetical protein
MLLRNGSRNHIASLGDQIRANLDRTQLETGRSINLDEGRRKMPNLASLDERSLVDVVQHVYYPNIAKAELASRLSIDAPPDPFNVALTCHQFTGGSPAERGRDRDRTALQLRCRRRSRPDRGADERAGTRQGSHFSLCPKGGSGCQSSLTA